MVRARRTELGILACLGWSMRKLFAVVLLEVGANGLAAGILLRTPGRTALAAVSLGIGVCALTLLFAATIAFHDIVLVTLLGDAVAVACAPPTSSRWSPSSSSASPASPTSSSSTSASALTELASLGATGWDDRALGRLVVFEGLWIVLLGAVAGALGRLVATAALAGALLSATAPAAPRPGSGAGRSSHQLAEE